MKTISSFVWKSGKMESLLTSLAQSSIETSLLFKGEKQTNISPLNDFCDDIGLTFSDLCWLLWQTFYL